MLRGAGEQVVVDMACFAEVLVDSHSFARHSPTTADGTVRELEEVSVLEQEIRSLAVVNEGLLERDVDRALFLDPSTQKNKKNYP